MNEIKECFGRLYDSFINSEFGTDLINPRCSAKYTTFTAMCGHKYFTSKDINGNDFRFMLVGRAVNGWDEYRINPEMSFTRESFIESSMMNITNDKNSIVFGADRFEWINTNNTPKNTPRLGIDLFPEKCSGYYVARSSIWNYSKGIWDTLYGKETEWKDRWFESIVWSNLFKIAPHNEGNPPPEIKEIEKLACIDLIKAEIEYFEPTHIYFAAGIDDWFEHFSLLFHNYSVIGKNKNFGNNRNFIYVEGTAEYQYQSGKNAKVIIACRPERRNKDKYIEQITNYFNQ